MLLRAIVVRVVRIAVYGMLSASDTATITAVRRLVMAVCKDVSFYAPLLQSGEGDDCDLR